MPGVLDYISMLQSLPPLSPAFFSPCSWPTLVFSFQPHQPRLLGAIASSPSPFFSWTSTSSSPCFSTYSCLSNGPHLAQIEGLQQTHSPSSGDNQAFPHSQITGGMNVCLYVSHDLSLSLSTGFLGHSPLCALHSPSLSQQPCRLLPGLYFGDIAVVMNHSRRDWRGLPRCSKESNAIYTLHHSHASSHPCPYPSLCSAPHQFVSTDSDWSHHTLMCMSAFVWFSIDGKFGLVENVTEEVQSLRNRVELLEKVHRKTQEHMFNHIKATYSDTSQSGSPGKPLSLVCDLTS